MVKYFVPAKFVQYTDNEVSFTPPGTTAGENNIYTYQMFPQLLLDGLLVVCYHGSDAGDTKRGQPGLHSDQITGV